MVTESAVLVFNGEIYNFRQLRKEIGGAFRTNSDTEVILAAYQKWGQQCVSRLHGMFAFVLFDRRTRSLFAARDRLGIKPFFYSFDGEEFIFSSELAPLEEHLLPSRRRLNLTAVRQYLHLGFVPDPQCIYEGVAKLPPGSALVLERGLLRTFRYWSPRQRPIESNAEHFERTLRTAVENHLVSDVPVGAFLSGGTDSSLIAALATDTSSEPIRTFSIGFEDAKHNELASAQRVAEILGTRHRSAVLKETDAKDLFASYFDIYDEPCVDLSLLPTLLVSRLAHEDVKVVLAGDGGDELFLGYGSHTWSRRLARMGKSIKPLLGGLLRISPSERHRRAATLFENVAIDEIRSHIFSQEQYLYTQRETRQLMRGSGDGYRWNAPEWLDSEEQRQAFFELETYLPGDLLTKVDRASMHHSLEVRVPLLDHLVVESALGLPLSDKFRNGRQKFLLKQILGKYLPPDLVHQRKWGFSVPFHKWLRNDFSELVTNFLPATLPHYGDLINPAIAQRYAVRFIAGEDHLYQRVWAIIALLSWLERHPTT